MRVRVRVRVYVYMHIHAHLHANNVDAKFLRRTFEVGQLTMPFVTIDAYLLSIRRRHIYIHVHIHFACDDETYIYMYIYILRVMMCKQFRCFA